MLKNIKNKLIQRNIQYKKENLFKITETNKMDLKNWIFKGYVKKNRKSCT